MQLTPNQEDALNIERHVCVTAGAGSGKTSVLVRRYLKILRKGNIKTPQEIVAITFTVKAAAEIKERIVEELSVHRENEGIEQDNSLQRFREEMNSAHISTIHAFCSRILGEFPFQAGVPANFSIIQGIDQRLLLQQAIKGTLKEIATNALDRHRAELGRLLRRYGGQQKLVDFFSTMVNQRDIIEHLIREIYDDRVASEIRGDWEQRVRIELMVTIDRLMSKIDVIEFIRCLNPVLKVAKGKKAEEAKKLTEQLEVLCEQNPDSPAMQNLLKEIAGLITIQDGSIRTPSFLPKSIDRTEIMDQIKFLEPTAKKIKDLPVLEKEKDDDKRCADNDDGDKGDDETVAGGANHEDETDDDFLINTTRDLLTLYSRILSDYQITKLLQGKLDHSDLQLKTRDLLRDNEEIRRKLRERYKYYMIDEYQDTNELQHELVMLLTNDLKDANLFIVGDPKQSIYRFRGADVRVFEKTKRKIIAEGGLDISLTENFRSLRDVIGFVNYFFYRLMGDGSESEFETRYEALTQARRVNTEGSISILLGKQDDKEANEYKLIVQHVKSMRANGATIWERDEGGVEVERPIEYGDIAILIQSRTHLPDIEHALLEADIPYLTAGGIGFYQRQEIYDIWNYLNFLDTPEKKQTSLVGVLRGPAFGISDTELYEISLRKEENFWDQAQNHHPCTEHLSRAIATLKKHIQIAHRMPVNQLILTIVNETGMIGTLQTGKQGQQRWANYQKLLEFARNFDGDENARTLSDFIEFLEILIKEERREGQAPIESRGGAVQIMTIHAAKGSQFPVIILPRLDRGVQSDREPFIDEIFGIGFSPLKPEESYRKTEPSILTHMKDRSNEKETAEKKRLFYVGATRAQDRLILSGTLPSNGKPQQMLKWLHENLDLDEENRVLNLDIKQGVFAGGATTRQSFQLQVPISRSLADTALGDEVSDETTLVKFPEFMPSDLKPAEIPAAFSVAELANYARCSLRYQLENVLRIPVNGQGAADLDEAEVDAAIHYMFSQIRQRSDVENLDMLIEQVSENYPELTNESETTLRTCVNNFLNSELAETVFNASETSTNQQIHANINEHIIDARFDRLFRDETGDWQVINYKTDEIQNIDDCLPEMELYSLLLHRRYPSQPTLTINFFFTEHNRCERMHFNTSQLQEIQEQWKKRISELQQGNYEKNLDHCCSCPYADPDGQCIITEA